LCFLIPVLQVGAQDTPAPKSLNIEIIEGDGAVNNVKQRLAREPIVQVEDENRKPIAGAAVVFFLPDQGASASFPGGAKSLTVTTDTNGRAVARGLQSNSVRGAFSMRVTASYRGLTASKSISMTNMAAPGGMSAAAKVWTVLAIAGAAAAGAVVAVNSGNNSGSPPAPGRPPTTISPGTPSVGTPR
jgi:hypothetical protein